VLNISSFQSSNVIASHVDVCNKLMELLDTMAKCHSIFRCDLSKAM